MEDFFVTLCIQFANRSNLKKKTRFINWFVTHMETKGFPCEIQEQTIIRKTVRNIIVGDIRNANTILIASYDTPLKLLIPLKYYPINFKKQEKQQILILSFQFIVSLIFEILFVYLCYYSFPWKTITNACMFLFSIIVFFTGLWIGKGVGNRNNYHRSHAALSVLYQYLIDNKKDKVCLVLIDDTCLSTKGYEIFVNNYDIQSKKVIILNCVGLYDDMVVTTLQNQVVRNSPCIWNKVDKKDDTILNYFKNAYVISDGRMEHNDVVVNYTASRKDCCINFKAMKNTIKLINDLAYNK